MVGLACQLKNLKFILKVTVVRGVFNKFKMWLAHASNFRNVMVIES